MDDVNSTETSEIKLKKNVKAELMKTDPYDPAGHSMVVVNESKFEKQLIQAVCASFEVSPRGQKSHDD